MNTSPTSPPANEDHVELAQPLSTLVPAVRVVKGDPDDAELAALVAGLAAAVPAAAVEESPAASSVWTDRRPRWGLPPQRGSNGWKWSAHRR